MARLNGDEFMALLPEVIDEREAELVATRILDLMREPIMVGGQECFVTASVGISMFPRDGENAVDLMRNADVAMQAVKASGRNSVSLYSPSLAGRGARCWNSKAPCTRRSNATSWCCTISPRSTCAVPAWWAPRP